MSSDLIEDSEEVTRVAGHEEIEQSWQLLKQVPTDNSAYLLMLVGPNAPRMFPVGNQVTIGRSSASTVFVDDESVSRNHARIVESEDGHFRLEDLGSRNGTHVNGDPKKKHLLESGDRVQFGSSSIFLVTYHTRLEDQLLEIKKLESEGRLAGGLGLNFRSILKPLGQQVDVLQQLVEHDQIDKNAVQAALAEIASATRRAQDLTQQLLNFARTGDFRESDVDLSEILRDSVRMIPLPIDRSVDIQTDVEPDLKMTGDALHLRTMLMHLTDNALAAMTEGETLTIAARKATLDDERVRELPLVGQRDAIEVTVADTGGGMGEEVVRRAFDPFYSTKPTHLGTGLGLAIVERVVRSHRGYIELESEMGQGTTARITFPLAA